MAEQAERDSAVPQHNAAGTAGVIARPIRLFPAALLLGFLLDHLLPLPIPIPKNGLAHGIGVVMAGILLLTGIALFRAAVTNFSRAATPLPTNQPARVLVATGIYGRTRNPVYLSFFLLYIGIGIAVHSPWILALTVPIAAVIRYGVVGREETYLESRFGEAYRDYKARVRRWL